MLVRCQGDDEQYEAVKSWMRIRGTCAEMLNINSWWHSAHTNAPRRSKSHILRKTLTQNLPEGMKLDRRSLIHPDDYERFDEECVYRLWNVMWPVAPIAERQMRHGPWKPPKERWLSRLRASIKKHGVKLPLLGWLHTSTRHVVREEPGAAQHPHIFLGNNRLMIAHELGIEFVPVILSLNKGKAPPKEYKQERVSFGELHDIMNHADLIVSREQWMFIHPPTNFFDTGDGSIPDEEYGSNTLGE